jgi:hypothetical protein
MYVATSYTQDTHIKLAEDRTTHSTVYYIYIITVHNLNPWQEGVWGQVSSPVYCWWPIPVWKQAELEPGRKKKKNWHFLYIQANVREESTQVKYFHFKNCHLNILLKFKLLMAFLQEGTNCWSMFGIVKTRTPTRYLSSSHESMSKHLVNTTPAV